LITREVRHIEVAIAVRRVADGDRFRPLDSIVVPAAGPDRSFAKAFMTRRSRRKTGRMPL
jgi:hypothetical protein